MPAAAGRFYPADADELKKKIKDYLFSAKSGIELILNPKAIIAPHAGYDYSGLVAATAYGAIKGKEIDTVVIICNSHTDYFSGVAIDKSDAWETPLGSIPVDHNMAARLIGSSDLIKFNSEVHTSDHTLEVQLPFLQTVLQDGFKIVPIVFGNTGDDAYLELAAALANNLEENDLIVVSTDLSHYPGYADAKAVDKFTLENIKRNDIKALEEYIKATESKRIANLQILCCGTDGVKTLMALAEKLDWTQAKILKYANSGDAAIGDKTRVVGYAAMAFGRKLEIRDQGSGIGELSGEQKNILLKIARETVEARVNGGKRLDYNIQDERLNRREGAFVTLKIRGDLRGCIGQIIPSGKPLWQVVRDMAVSSCLDDPRFLLVNKSELCRLEYEVSVLSAPKRIDDWQKIELGRHGVIIKQGCHSGVFLPQVALETGWDLETFLSELCLQKAGLHSNSYKDNNTEIQVFTAQVFGDKDK